MQPIIPVMLFCIILLCACTAPKYIYSPTTANLLELDGPGEIKLAANFAHTSPVLFSSKKHTSQGLDIQSAYALTKRVGVRADVYTKSESNESIAESNGVSKVHINYKKKGVEISGGIYNFSKSKTTSMVQLFAGLGAGKFSFQQTNNSVPVSSNYHETDYFKLFIQPSLTAVSKKNYSLVFGARMSVIYYKNIQTDYSDLTKEPLGYIDTKPSLFADMIIRHEFGFTKLPGVRFQFQNGFASLLTNFSSSEQDGFKDFKYDYNDRWIAVGIIVDVKKVFKVTGKE